MSLAQGALGAISADYSSSEEESEDEEIAEAGQILIVKSEPLDVHDIIDSETLLSEEGKSRLSNLFY
jgi:hypothetical protein